jgi:integrase
MFIGVNLGKFKHLWEEAAAKHVEARKKKLNKRLRKEPDDEYIQKRVRESEEDMYRKFDAVANILDGKDISEINQSDIDTIKSHLFNKGLKEATVNRHLSLYLATLNRCRDLLENDDGSPWLNRVPKFIMEEEDDPVEVDISQEQLSDVYSYLPEVQQDMMVVSIETGLRDSSMRLMKKNQIDFTERTALIKGAYMKNTDPIEVPFNEPCFAAILRACNRYPDSEYVFATYTGRPIFKCSNKLWYGALIKANMQGEYKWHWNRHLFVQNHIADGTPESVIMDLGGWKTANMIRRYAKTKGRKYAKFVESAATNLTQLADYKHTKVA